MRDDFSENVKRTIAARVGNRCSKPDCRMLTSGPQDDPTKSLNVGVASHITAASEGGPRFNPSLTSEERRHPNNAIWLCQVCGKLVDNDDSKFPEVVLRKWKQHAEAEAFALIGKTASVINPKQSGLSLEEFELLIAAADQGWFALASSDMMSSDYVRTESRDFFDDLDQAVAAIYLDAFYSLSERGLVRPQGDGVYSLTGRGFKLARELSPR